MRWRCFESCSISWTQEPVTALDTASAVTSHRWPSALPGGVAVVFTMFRGQNDDASLAVASLESGDVKPFEILGVRGNPRAGAGEP